MESPGVMLSRYEGKRCYADIECVGHGRELCLVCEMGLGEVVDWGTPLGSCSLRVGYTDDEALAECAGGTGDSIQCYGGVARVEEAIELGAAGMKLLGHGALGLLLFAHGLLQLPRQHALDSNGLDLFTDAFGFEEAIEG